MSILSLPAELRLTIYSLLLPPNPLSAPCATYTGLLYSCTELHNELESEIVKRAASSFVDIQARCRAVHGDADMHYDEPTCMKDLHHMKFTRPVHITMFARNDPFMALFYLDFSTLTVAALPASGCPSAAASRAPAQAHLAPRHSRSATNLVQWISRLNDGQGQGGARRIRYEWPFDPQPWTSVWQRLADRRLVAWKVHLCSDGSKAGYDPLMTGRGPAESPRVIAIELEKEVGRVGFLTHVADTST